MSLCVFVLVYAPEWPGEAAEGAGSPGARISVLCFRWLLGTELRLQVGWQVC